MLPSTLQHQQPMSLPAMALPVQQVSSSAQTADLWLKIDQLHLNYLKAEEGHKKMDIRKKLEGYIHQYLCLVPQDRKFCRDLTGVVLSESVRFLPGFSALKAAQAFKAMEEYAANLINQPWRKEFREIKQYGGFYKHHIDSSLSGAERFFQLMGYESSSGQTLVLHGQVDQDRVTTVARDCVLACMECQILVTIVQGVSATFPCTWEEALAFRRDHVGTPEQAVRSIVYHKSQMQFHTAQQNSAPPASLHPAPPAPPSSYSTANGSTVYSPQPYYQAQQYTSLQQQMYPQVSVSYNNGYASHQPLSLPPQPAVSAAVPTAQLVDLNLDNAAAAAPSPRHASDAGSVNGAAIPLTIKHLEEENRRKSYQENGAANPSAAAQYESWDYVYRQLENIGYTKDQGERPDVLALLNKVSLARQKSDQQRIPQKAPQHPPDRAALSPLSLEERELLRQIQGVTLDSPAAAMGDGEDVPDAVHRRLRARNADGDARDSANSHSHRSGARRDSHKAGAATSSNAGSQVAAKERRRSKRHSRPLSPPKQHELAPPPSDAGKSGGGKAPRWKCHACTYNNKAKVDICEMCGKSRNSPDLRSYDEVDAGGGGGGGGNGAGDDAGVVACEKCTLQNPVDQRVCQVCGATLPHWVRGRQDSEEEPSSDEE